MENTSNRIKNVHSQIKAKSNPESALIPKSSHIKIKLDQFKFDMPRKS